MKWLKSDPIANNTRLELTFDLDFGFPVTKSAIQSTYPICSKMAVSFTNLADFWTNSVVRIIRIRVFSRSAAISTRHIDRISVAEPPVNWHSNKRKSGNCTKKCQRKGDQILAYKLSRDFHPSQKRVEHETSTRRQCRHLIHD